MARTLTNPAPVMRDPPAPRETADVPPPHDPPASRVGRIKRAVKRGIKRLALRSGWYPGGRRQREGRVVAFTVHRALSDDTPAGDWRRLLGHPTVSELRRKLEYLKGQAEFISVGRCVDLVTRREPMSADRLVLTVDDGYLDFRTNLLPLLEELRIPAGLFVCTSASEEGRVWFQDVYQLIDAVRGEHLDVPWAGVRIRFGAARHRVLTVEHVLLRHLKTLGRGQRTREVDALLRANGVRPSPDPADAFCSPDDLRAVARSPWVELHPHGHRHDPLDTLSDDELSDDLSRCRAFLRDRVGVESSVLGYPNGTCRPEQWPVLRARGITHAFSMRPGFEVPPNAEPLALRRNGFGAETIEDFAWSVQGMLRG